MKKKKSRQNLILTGIEPESFWWKASTYLLSYWQRQHPEVFTRTTGHRTFMITTLDAHPVIDEATLNQKTCLQFIVTSKKKMCTVDGWMVKNNLIFMNITHAAFFSLQLLQKNSFSCFIN